MGQLVEQIKRKYPNLRWESLPVLEQTMLMLAEYDIPIESYEDNNEDDAFVNEVIRAVDKNKATK